MIALRYSAGKIWANYLLAVVAGLVVVVILGSLWSGSALVGGLAGLVAVAVMLLIGCIKRAGHKEPIVVVDEHGVTIGLPKIGTIPWNTIRRTEIKGVPWVTGVRLVVEHTGPTPKLGFMDKLNWAMQAKKRGELTHFSIGLMDLTDRPVSALKAALSGRIPQAAS